MLKIVEMSVSEQKELLDSMNFGHLGCAQDNQPYVLPMHYAFDGENIFFLTVEGQKTEWLAANPKVCFQVEKVADERHWQSVLVIGRVVRLTEPEQIGRATNFIFKKHSSLTPAVNRTIVRGEEKFFEAAVYSLSPNFMSGRKTARL